MNKLMAMVEKRSVASSALQTLRVVQIISKPPPPTFSSVHGKTWRS